MRQTRFPVAARSSAAAAPARFLHPVALSRSVPLTPLHNMALISPEQSEADVDRHPAVCEAVLTRPAEAGIG